MRCLREERVLEGGGVLEGEVLGRRDAGFSSDIAVAVGGLVRGEIERASAGLPSASPSAGSCWRGWRDAGR